MSSLSESAGMNHANESMTWKEGGPTGITFQGSGWHPTPYGGVICGENHPATELPTTPLRRLIALRLYRRRPANLHSPANPAPGLPAGIGPRSSASALRFGRKAEPKNFDFFVTMNPRKTTNQMRACGVV
jgi:hypothetical protein